MAKKRPIRRRSRTVPKKSGKRPQRSFESQVIENRILAALYGADDSLSLRDLTGTAQEKRSSGNEIKDGLTRLLKSRLVEKADNKQYALAPRAPIYMGTLQQNRKGFGFVTTTKKNARAPELSRDVFIPIRGMYSAMHGDSVLIRLISESDSTRPEGAVIAVLERGPDLIAGIYRKEGGEDIVYPDDNRYPFLIRLGKTDHPPSLQEGDAVITKIQLPERPSTHLNGTIVELLGPADNIDVQMRLVIEKHHLPHQFSKEALSDAEPAVTSEDFKGREDLRQIPHVTIDGETAKDFDDAVFVKRVETGYRLYVSIADVSHFVTSGSQLDQEAYQRGTSIYFPGRVIPMLPESLSNNLCSLIPDQDRLTLTAILDFNFDGKRTNKQFCRSVIRSHKRFTYTTVAKILVDRDKEIIEQESQFVPMLSDAAQLAKALLRKRKLRGSIGFTLPEAEMSLDSEGSIQTIQRAERNFAHQVIEEFMLAANEAVADTFTRNKRPSLFRIHELPDLAKIKEFTTFARTLNLKLPRAEATPQWFGSVLATTAGSPVEYVVNNLLLRTMQQARYSPENVGHFALAATDYTHFTSPIRRYPDLMVHRELCRLISDRKKKTITRKSPPDLQASGEFLSTRERTAIDAEREMADRLKIQYMEKHLGENFSAIISGVTEFALFIELTDLLIGGSIPLEDIRDEHYLHDGAQHRVVGEISGNIYQIGDNLEVTARAVDKARQRILFAPAGTK